MADRRIGGATRRFQCGGEPRERRQDHETREWFEQAKKKLAAIDFLDVSSEEGLRGGLRRLDGYMKDKGFMPANLSARPNRNASGK